MATAWLRGLRAWLVPLSATCTLWFAGLAEGQNVEFRQFSSPAGVINQTSYPAYGSEVSTVPAQESILGYRFTHWTINGVRSEAPTGRARNPVKLTIVAPVEAVAHYLPENQDSDGDGILDWIEVHHLRDLQSGPNNDPDTDGFTTRIDLDRGYDPAARDVLAAGGISRRRASVTLNIPQPPEPPDYSGYDLDGDGMIGRVETARGYTDRAFDRLEAGGTSRRRSAPLFAVVSANHVRLHESSSPAGVFVQERVVVRGSTVDLYDAPLTSNGYRFTGWLVNGTRVDRPPLNQPTPLTVTADTRAVARYILETADTDADGIPDWMEWYFHESLGHTLASDPDGDGIPWGAEQFRGYSTVAADTLTAGGVSRRRSRVLDVDRTGTRLPWRIASVPGVLAVQDGLAVPGSTVTTPDLRTSTYGNWKFAYWEVNGVRQTDASGYALGEVAIKVHAPVEAVARYFDTSVDDDFDGVNDWYERVHFGTLAQRASDDGDGDGLTLAGEVFRGYSPLVRDRMEAGGVSRRRSTTLAVNTAQVSVPPYVTANGPTDVTATSARLNALVNAAGLPATVFFEYGPTPAYGANTPAQSLSGTLGASAVSSVVSGLQPATVYHFRVVAENSQGVTRSGNLTFSTLWDASVAEGFEDAGVAGRWLVNGGVWGTGGAAAASGAAGAGTNPGGQYPAGSDSRFVSPLFEVPAAAGFPRLRFDHRWQFGTGDHGAVEVREGTTGPWQTVATVVGQSPDWVDKALDLSGFGGRRVQVAFRLLANADASVGTGWSVDNVRLETGVPNGWAAQSPEGFEPMSFWRAWTAVGAAWDCGAPTSGPGVAFEGSTCAATSLGGNYPANFDGRLVSPFVQVPAAGLNPRLRFWHWFHFGAGDRGSVEIRRLGGSWQTLETFTGAGGTAWAKPAIDLSSAAGEWVQLAFRLVSDASDHRPGWYLDAAEIVTGAEVLNSPETFDASTGDWFADAGGLWQVGRPASGPGAARSGNNLAATNLAGNYPANSSARFSSPRFLVGDPGPGRLVTLGFWQWFRFGAGDGGTVQISVADGEAWSDWVPLLNVSGQSNGWQQGLVDLSLYRGKTVRIGFLLSADGDGSTGPGWYLDDIGITTMVRGEMTPGVPVRADLAGSGQFQYYALTLDTAGPLNISLANAGAGNRLELFAGRGVLPSRGSSEFAAAKGPGASRELVIPWAAAGTWYLLVYGDTVVTPGSFTLTAMPQGLTLTGVTPGSHATNVAVEMVATGAGFRAGTVVELVGGGRVIAANAVVLDSFTRLTATFGAGSVPPGSYDLRVRSANGGTATLAGAFQSLAAGEPKFETRVVMPGSIGPRTPATILVEYANTGTASMVSPLVVLRPAAGSARPILTLDQTQTVQNFWAGTLDMPPGASSEVFILASGEQAGVLHPGERRQVPVYYSGLLGWTGGPLALETVFWTEADSSPMNWAAVKDEVRPPTLEAEVWDVVYANLTDGLSTTGEYVRMLNDNARHLGRLGLRVLDVDELWNFELMQAYGISVLPVVESATDAAVAAPGGGLELTRQFSSNLRSRRALGPFGRGWFTPWQTRLVSENGGAVVRIVGEAGAARVFVRDSRNGGYFSGAGDSSKLVSVGGGFELREPHGGVTRFNSAGRIGYVEDINGNRVTASYQGDQLSGLQHRSGATITLAYNGAGFVSRVTDSAGRTLDYTYAGQYLASTVTGDGKVTSYVYQTSGSAARLHALTSVTRGGVTRSFTWDERGRLAATLLGAGEERLDLGYDSAGGMTMSDAGGTTSLFIDHRGLLVRSIDPLGNVTNSEYGSDLRLRRMVLPTGDSRSFTWCTCGSPTTITDELGQITRFSYDHPLKKMTRFVDAKGNTTSYEYDAKGNLLKTTYANQAAETLSQYTADGLPLRMTNRRNQVTQLTYHPSGELATRLLADGTLAAFDYDARGNLVKVTEMPPSGPAKVTVYLYTPASDGDRLRKVTYPNGSWVEYFYDANGRRARMTDSAGGDTRYNYDPVGRLWKLRDSNDAVIVEYLYDLAGRLLRINKGNGTYTTYQYDASGQILTLTNHAPDGTPNSRFEYTYDPRGRRTRMATLDGNWTYDYDATSQLVRAVFDSTNPQIPDQDLRYRYDALGNRTATVLNGTTTAYIANSLNQYTSVGGQAYQYDADGNLTFDGVNTYLYDQRNLLVRVTGPEGVMEFEYDALGNRMSRLKNGVIVEFLHDQTGWGSVLAEVTEKSAHTLNTYGKGMVTSGPIGGTVWFDYDGIGTAATTSDQSGAVLSRSVTDPWGNYLSGPDPASFAKRFIGQFGVLHEAESLCFMKMRYFSSKIGRFISQDPLGLGGGSLNLIAYVENNPISRIDPLGLWYFDFGYGGGAGGGAISGWQFGPGGYAKYVGVGVTTPGLSWGITLNSGDPTSGAGQQVQVGLGGGIGFTGSANFDPETDGSMTGAGAGVCGGIGSKCGGAGAYMTYSWAYKWNGKPIPPPGGTGGSSATSPVVVSRDPNEKLGPAGYGPGNWVRGGDPMAYRINFENLGPGSKDLNGNPYPTHATAPAQRVTIVDQLSPHFDWASFRLTEIGFGDVVVAVPGNSSHYAGTVPVFTSGGNFVVEIEAGIDFNSGRVTMAMQALDGQTGLPPDVSLGILPPEDGTGRGMGHLSFLIDAKSGLPNGTAIRNVAEIRFDTNEVIATNQIDPQDASKGTDPTKEALVTLDDGAPSITASATAIGAAKTDVQVQWQGNDRGGVGLKSYDVDVSVNGAAYQSWLKATQQQAAVYPAYFGENLRFRIIARDHLDQVSASPVQVELQVTDSYLVWRNGIFGNSVNDPNLKDSLWGDNADPDSDGLKNMAEFLGGTNPLVDDNPANFVPDIVVENPDGTTLQDNGPAVVLPDAAVGSTGTLRTFVIRNRGKADLVNVMLKKSGANPGDFNVPVTSFSKILPGEKKTFQVALAPVATGSRAATILLESNDPDLGTFRLHLHGNATELKKPLIVVEQPKGKALVDGKAVHVFGKVKVGQTSVARTYRIRNSGTADLKLSSIGIVGLHRRDFILTFKNPQVLKPRASVDFMVKFKPAKTGTRKAELRIYSNDLPHNPFNIGLNGTGLK